jgi:hypothetical protein
MPIDLPIVLLVAVVALIVASTAARRAGDHADRVAGRRPPLHASRRGPTGAVVDLIDQSVAAYGLRRRLGLSTKTRAERRADDARAALVAQAEEIRLHRMGGAPPVHPTHIVVAGRAGETPRPPRAPGPPSTLAFELIAAAIGLVLVIGIVVAIAPRGTGDVLSATGVPADPTPVVATPTASSPPSAEPAAT